MPLQLNSESDAFLITDPINIRGKGIILITVGHESFLGERGEAWGENKAGRGVAAVRNIKKDYIVIKRYDITANLIGGY